MLKNAQVDNTQLIQTLFPTTKVPESNCFSLTPATNLLIRNTCQLSSELLPQPSHSSLSFYPCLHHSILKHTH